jgi:hypothetical protein
MTSADDEMDEMFGIGLDTEARVFAVVSALRAPATPEELVGEREAVATAVRLSGIDAEWSRLTSTPGRSTMRSLRRPIVAPLVVSVLVGTAGLAMAGALPAAAQDAVSNVFGRVGITVPPSEDHPDATTQSDEGTADTTASASTGEEISDLATTTDATGVAKGALISTAASGGMSRAGQSGSQSAPPTTAGPETGATASGGASTARSGNASQPPTP